MIQFDWTISLGSILVAFSVSITIIASMLKIQNYFNERHVEIIKQIKDMNTTISVMNTKVEVVWSDYVGDKQ